MASVTDSPAPEASANQEAELVLGRAVAIAVPAVSVLMAILVGLTVGLGPAILLLAGGGIVGTISLLWASVRTLSGDAPLAEGLTSAAPASGAAAAGADRKRAALRALKDLDFERSVGKIDQADYDELVLRYRAEAKSLMREMDQEIDPFRARAEEIAQKHLAKVGLTAGASSAAALAPDAPALADPSGDLESHEPDDDAADPTDEDDDESPLANARSAHGSPANLSAVPVTPFGAPRATRPRATDLLPVPRGERIPCVTCSASNEADAAFCKKCGAALRPECGTCHAKNEPDAAFCKKCGAKLSSGHGSTKGPDAAS